MQAQVAHDRADDGILGELAARLHIRRAHRHHTVAVYQATLFIHCDQAVGVAVKRQANVRPAFPDCRL